MVYIGTPRSARRIALYDKPIDGELGTTLRLETRLHPKILGQQLAAIANPFTGIGLVPANFSDSAGLNIPAQYIADSVRLGGIRRALEPLDAPGKKALKKAYGASQSLIPNLDALWAKWPETIANCGLGKQLGAIPIKAYKAV